MRWLVAAVLWFGICARLAAAEAEAPKKEAVASPSSLESAFFPVRTDGIPTRIEREVLGVIVQEVTLALVRTRGTVSEYRLTLRLRNPSRQALHSDLRLILWGEEKPIVAFDIRTEDRGMMIPPRSGVRFVSQFDLDKETRITRLSLVPLPPQTLVVRTDQPVPLTTPPVQEEQGKPTETPSPSAQTQQAPQASEGQQQPTPDALRQQQEWLRYQAEIARMYRPRILIPNVNAWGNLMSIGPYGPQYGLGDGLFLNTPYGVVPLQTLPPAIYPYPMWGVPVGP